METLGRTEHPFQDWVFNIHSCSEHESVKLKILREVSKTNSRITTLVSRRVISDYSQICWAESHGRLAWRPTSLSKLVDMVGHPTQSTKNGPKWGAESWAGTAQGQHGGVGNSWLSSNAKSTQKEEARRGYLGEYGDIAQAGRDGAGKTRADLELKLELS